MRNQLLIIVDVWGEQLSNSTVATCLQELQACNRINRATPNSLTYIGVRQNVWCLCGCSNVHGQLFVRSENRKSECRLGIMDK